MKQDKVACVKGSQRSWCKGNIIARGINYYLGVIGCNHRTGVEGMEELRKRDTYLTNKVAGGVTSALEQAGLR